MLIRQLQARMLQYLRRVMGLGISEYELIKKLQADNLFPDGAGVLSQPISLFRMHFITFHCLYDLRDRLWQKKIGHLAISPLSIQLFSYCSQPPGLSAIDALRDYYLDLNHVATMTENDVNHCCPVNCQNKHS
jgi:hypothetical protein